MDCSIALVAIADWRKVDDVLILRDIFHGVTRFDDFPRRLECSPAVLSARLKTLTEAGLLRRVGYKELRERERFRVPQFTRAAVELLPVLVGLMQWAIAT
ncbi:winged helix-turn-helix transcriptional regulator [Cupriavidus basilensis]